MRHVEKIQRKHCTRWQIRFEDVNRRMRYRTFPTRAKAEAFAREIDRAKDAGIDPSRRVRFHELVKEWTESHLTHNLRASSVKDYKQSLKRLSVCFGQRELRGITASNLEKCRNELVIQVQSERLEKFERVLASVKAKVKPGDTDKAFIARADELRAEIKRGGIRATGKMIGCARMLWKFATSRGYASRNIALDVKKPTSPPLAESGVIDSNILTPAEIERHIAAMFAEDRVLGRFLYMTGVRYAEALGAEWTDMDWHSSRIIIRRQRSEISGEMTVPKTKAGVRWIDLPAGLITELKAHKLRTLGATMFPVDARNWRSRVWHPALRRAGLRSIRIHDARHTHASLLIASGADIVAISRRLGHANPSITLNVYAHTFARRDAAPLGEKLAAFMRRETVGCGSAAPTTKARDANTEVVELAVARGGIEPPTRGFSVRCSTN
jgi:integrase